MAELVRTACDESGICIRSAFRNLRRRIVISPEEFWALAQVADETAIPETVTQRQYPSVKYIRCMSIARQIRYLRECARVRDINPTSASDIGLEFKTYQDLTSKECKKIFPNSQASIDAQIIRSFQRVEDKIRSVERWRAKWQVQTELA